METLSELVRVEPACELTPSDGRVVSPGRVGAATVVVAWVRPADVLGRV